MKTALVIDDVKGNRIFMSKCLEEEGYKVISVSNGMDALANIKEYTFDVIFLDMKLPGMSGMNIMRWLKENQVQTPVAVVTAHGTVNNAIESLNYGVIAYIRKPLSVERFKRHILEINEKLENGVRTVSMERPLENPADSAYEYAPAIKLTDDRILEQSKQILKNRMLRDLFDIIPNTVLILNKERQILYSNSYFLELIGINQDKPMGLRPGEVLNCVHAYENTNGCGTTECCSVCGAVQAIIQAQTTNSKIQKECLMKYKSGENELSRELLIVVNPADYILEGATIFIAKDISNEKLRKNMERLFFHDLLNTSGSIKGLAEYAEKIDQMDEIQKYMGYINDSTDYMIDEINFQKMLLSAENNELNLIISRFSLNEIIYSIIRYYSDTEFIFNSYEDVKIVSDRVLVYRVVMNMIKNAVEADRRVITIDLDAGQDYIELSVHNHGFMPKEIQLQLFKKFFSTKGSGRGIGTYSMKLIGESFLKGEVWCESSPDSGTRFTFRIPRVLN
ncbi:MAG TPA: response regulator [Clostridiales bacterium]|nr:response regulator [Clostridiales bacterium]